jgi:plastocyanin
MPIRLALITAGLAMIPLAHAADLTVRVLDKSGQPLPSAVVQVESAVPGAQGVPVTEATIRQEKLRFRPYITVVSTGARVTFTNEDAWDHHVIVGPVGPGGFYLDAAQNQQLRLSGKAGDVVAQDSRRLQRPGAYLLGCHLHSSMRGHIYVTDAPWARLSDAQGQAVVGALPAGPARLRVWHPDQVLEEAPVTVQIPAGGLSTVINTQIVALKRR